MSALFGPAGNAENFPYKSSVDAPRWLREIGLDCYEYQCGKGIHVGEDTARRVGQAAAQHGIVLSLHAPYFINLANPDREALQKTIGYITGACLVADWMGARRVVIHSGALMKRTRREALDIALASLREVIAACDGAGFGHITLCPETMGKINQLGDLDEVLELCALDGRLLPCVDFGHLYARSLGADEGAEAMERMLDRMEAAQSGPPVSTATSPTLSSPWAAARSATAPLPTTGATARTGRPWPRRWRGGVGAPPSSARARAPRRRTP